ncbi:MAG: hypothetical protein Q7S22_02345 [Candidatus Micrarchaeota archaeon]|nr:hypothetical protein [Candidatus Micrarchaeota archaeon]
MSKFRIQKPQSSTRRLRIVGYHGILVETIAIRHLMIKNQLREVIIRIRETPEDSIHLLRLYSHTRNPKNDVRPDIKDVFCGVMDSASKSEDDPSKKIVKIIMSVIKDKTSPLRLNAAVALTIMSNREFRVDLTEVAVELAELIDGPYHPYKDWTVSALGNCYSCDHTLYADLLYKIIRDPGKLVNRYDVINFFRIRRLPIPNVAHVMHGEKVSLRSSALHSLDKFLDNSDKVPCQASSLLKAFNEGDSSLRSHILEIFGKMAVLDLSLLKYVELGLHDNEDSVRRTAAKIMENPSFIPERTTGAWTRIKIVRKTS